MADVMIVGLFEDSEKAGEAVGKLKASDDVKEISLVSRDEDTGEVSSHQIENDAMDGAAVGAATGGFVGLITGVLAATANVVLPGLGPVLVAGPLVATWALTGGALGALAGGLVGALVDLGIPEKRATLYEEAVQRGEVLVVVTTDDEHDQEVQEMLTNEGLSAMEVIKVE